MATATDVARIRRANRRIVGLAVTDVRRLWARLDLTDAMQVRAALEETVPALVDAYGGVSAAAAAEWYEQLRIRQRVPGRFSPWVATAPDVEAVGANVRWAISPLFSRRPDVAAALDQVEAELSRMVLRPGWDTIVGSAVRDPRAAGWQRIAAADACKFCVALASKGAVYKRSTARFAAHTNCSCTAAPSWDLDAPEVSVNAYRASERRLAMSNEELARRRAATRAWLNREFPHIRG